MNTQQAREKWLAVLRDPKSRKKYYQLSDRTKDHSRCCLGHACYALGTDPNDSLLWRQGQLPLDIAKKLDITRTGDFKKPIMEGVAIPDLAELNDQTTLAPANIADIIEREFKNDNFKPFDTEGDLT